MLTSHDQARHESANVPGQAVANFDIEVFYDGACPLWMREIWMLQGRDRRQRICFVDLAEDGFDAASVGLSWDALMDRLTGRCVDGACELHEKPRGLSANPR